MGERVPSSVRAVLECPMMRVQDLAEELGVDPVAILAKCKAEDIPEIHDRLSWVGPGLAATIRLWFERGERKGQ